MFRVIFNKISKVAFILVLSLVPQTKLYAENVFPHAVVAADHPAASQAGVDVMKEGGNVVDAAVATSFALSVVRPESCGIGGGGFMMIWNSSIQKSFVLDYREVAPIASKTEQFYGSGSGNGHPSRTGHRAVAVPGTVAGLCYASKYFGKLPLEKVIAPAIRLAEQGVKVDPFFVKVQKEMLVDFHKFPGYKMRFQPLWKDYLNSGEVRKVGDVFYSPQLKVLKRIQEEGAQGFYSGEVAAGIVKEMNRGAGLLTSKDLLEVKPKLRTALQGDFQEFKILGMPPPSSGGVAMIEMINILNLWFEKHPGKDWNNFSLDDPESMQLLIEAMKYAYSDRATYLGDPDFVSVPVDKILSRQHALKIAAKIKLDHTKHWKEYGSTIPINDAGTCHISVIDNLGNAVACTETINTHFGSYVVVPEYGIVLNNEMDDFTAEPGKPNAFGLIQSQANSIQPGKKPLSSMSPTILIKDGKAITVAGASGGPKIISSTLLVLLRMILHQDSPKQAVNRPRFHHQWLPDKLFLEKELFQKAGPTLKRKGHQIQKASSLGAVQAVWRSDAGVSGGSDVRKNGAPAGF